MPPSDRTPVQPDDTRLFAEQAIWFMRERGRTRLDFVDFVANWVGPETRRRVLRMLPLASKEQRDAEEAVCRLLNPGVLTDSKVVRRREAPDRGTDWVHTYVAAEYLPPLTYLERHTRQVLDHDLCGALAHLAGRLKGQLDLADDRDVYRNRINRLRGALNASQLRTIRMVGFGARHLLRLQLTHPDEERAIRAYFDLLRRRLGDEDEGFLRRLAEQISQCTV
ncbi:MAG: hypothetical protein MUE60_10435, partial [Candidatus Eisenbacteria bacterium]|nr:hypothetical protein [Candidatus Eisenbacteria bacterium]